jgi:hypothetical protein
MSLRRLAVIVVVLGSIAALLVTARNAPASTQAVFTKLATPSTPYLPLRENTLTNNYFCPGVPAKGENGGKVIVTNPTDNAMSGQVYVYQPEGDPLIVPVDVAARQQQTIDVGAMSEAQYLGVMVELDGRGAGVDQTAVAPTGSSLTPCTNAPSEHWYFADGTTVDGVDYDLILTNPYPDTASVHLTFATASGERTPPQFDGFVIPPHSVRFVDVDGAGARQESQLSVSVDSLRGRVVAGRYQSFSAGGRRGLSVALGAPVASTTWNFADGETGEGITETYTLYNPTDSDVEAQLTVYPATPTAVPPQTTTTVKAGTASVINLATDVEGVPAGRHSVIVQVNSDDSGAAIVAERALTKPAPGGAGGVFTTVVLGTMITSPRWWVMLGVPSKTEAALVVANATGTKSAVTVSAVGPGGVVAIPSLSHLPLPAAGVITIDLTLDEVLDRPILVEADDDNVAIAVEQRYPRSGTSGPLPGRTGSFALPE